MDEILDVPVVFPELPTNPFEDEFKAKWYDRYRNDGCTKEHLQRLYNLDKLTEEDFITITGENPSEKTPPPQNEFSKLQDKISILKEENEQLREGLKAVLSGDMQTLAYVLYPNDFCNINK